MRETQEEAGAEVVLKHLQTVYDIPQIGQVYVIFLAQMLSPSFEIGPESLEARLFSPEEIPFEDIAFTSSVFALEKYLAQPDSTEVHFGIFRR